jgi:hypothetical protein
MFKNHSSRGKDRQPEHNAILKVFRQQLLQWKTKSVTHECESLALCIQHAMRFRHTAIGGLRTEVYRVKKGDYYKRVTVDTKSVGPLTKVKLIR